MTQARLFWEKFNAFVLRLTDALFLIGQIVIILGVILMEVYRDRV